MQITLYSKPTCHLCTEVKIDLLALQDEIDFVVVERNIEEDPADFERFRYLIPVLDIEGGEVLYPPHRFYTLRNALLKAQSVIGA